MTAVHMTWIGQGGYLLDCAGYRLVIDPYLSDALAARGLDRLAPAPLSPARLDADLICCTHDHADHYDPESMLPALAACARTRMAGPASVRAHAARDGVAAGRVLALERGLPLVAGPFTVVPVPARHSDPDAVGLVVLADGHALWFSADTLYDDALVPTARAAAGGALSGVVICINGKLGNMTADEALACVRTARPRFAWPSHYGMFAANTADPVPFVAAVQAAGIACLAPVPGTAYEL